MEYSFIKKSKKELKNKYDYIFIDNHDQENYIELSIAGKYYLFSTSDTIIPFKNDKVIIVHTWIQIVFISLNDGNLLYYSGLKDSFVDAESLKYDYLIITDMSLFLINKYSFYPWAYKYFGDYIVNYELSKADYKIKLYLATEDNVSVKLNFE